MIRKHFKAVCTFAILSILGVGCAAVNSTDSTVSATYSYYNGQLSTSFSDTFDATWAASLQAMRELEFQIELESKDSLNGKIVARRYNDQKVVLVLTKKTTEATNLSVTVGFFGDKEMSMRIVERIHDNL